MGTKKPPQVQAVRKNPKADLKLLAFSENVVTKSKGNANFANPGTVFTDLDAANQAFDASIKAMKTQKDAGPAKEAARVTVLLKLDHAVDFVNGAAAQAPLGQAAAIITSAGLPVRAVPVRNKPQLAVKYGNLAGVVLLVALAAAHNAVYVFEYSTDMKTWVTCPQVFKAMTTISGLTVGTTYYFRFQAQTRKGVQEWSNVVSFVVR
jgi:hypothetical protein